MISYPVFDPTLNIPISVEYEPVWCTWSVSDPSVWADLALTTTYTGSEIAVATNGVDIYSNDVSLIGTTQVVYVSGDVSSMYG